MAIVSACVIVFSNMQGSVYLALAGRGVSVCVAHASRLGLVLNSTRPLFRVVLYKNCLHWLYGMCWKRSDNTHTTLFSQESQHYVLCTCVYIHTQINGVEVSTLDLPDIVALLDTEKEPIITLTLYREASMTLL